MAGDPMRRNQSLYCRYHHHRHITEDCRNLWDHLDQLVWEGKLKQLLHHSSGRGNQTGSTFQGDASSRPLLGTINVIFAALGRTGFYPSRVMSVSCYPDEGSSSMPKRVKMGIPLVLGFSDEDKLGTIQPHNDSLVVTLRISGYDVKKGDDWPGQRSWDYVSWPLQWAKFETWEFNSLQFSYREFWRQHGHSKMLDQITRINWFGCGWGGLYCDKYFLSIYCHYGQTLASYLGSCFLHSSPEGEVSLGRPGAGDIRKPIYD